MWNDFEFFSLEDFASELRKSDDMKQAQQPKPVVNTTPKPEAPKPIVPAAQPPAPKQETEASGPTPVVPTKPEKKKVKKTANQQIIYDEENPLQVPDHVTCHHPAHHGQKQPSEGEVPEEGVKQHGTTYAPPSNPLVEGEQSMDKVSPQSLVDSLHRWRHIKDRKMYNLLSPSERTEHLQNSDPFMHITERTEEGQYKYPAAAAKLQQMVEDIAWPSYKQAIVDYGLDRFTNFNPGDKTAPEFKRFVNFVMWSMRPHLRTKETHGYGIYHPTRVDQGWHEGMKDHIANGNDPSTYGSYHSGIDTNVINTPKDLRNAIMGKIKGGGEDHWAKRFLETLADTGVGDAIGFNQIVPKKYWDQTRKAAKSYKDALKQLDAMSVKTGLSHPESVYVNPDANYSREQLKEIAGRKWNVVDENGLLSFIPQEGSGEDGWEFDLNKKKDSELRDALAERLNPKSPEEGSPFAKYNMLRKQLEHMEGVSGGSLYKMQDAMKAYKDMAESPSDRRQRAFKMAAESASIAEELAQSNPKHQMFAAQVNELVALAKERLPEGKEDEEYTIEDVADAKNFVDEAIKMVQGNTDPSVLQNVKALRIALQQYKTSIQEFESRFKQWQNPSYQNELEKRQQQYEAALDNYEDGQKDLQDVRNQIDSLKSHPDIQDFVQKEQDVAEKKAEWENLLAQLDEKKQVGSNAIVSLDNKNVGASEDETESSATENKVAMDAWKHDSGKEQLKDEEGNIIHSVWDTLPKEIDFENEPQSSIGDKTKKLLEAFNSLNHGHIIFGSPNNATGLLHVADHLLGKHFSEGTFHDIVNEFLEKYPANGPTPPMYKDDSQLKGGGWKKLHRMFDNEDSQTNLIKYALEFSRYHPFPHADADFFPPAASTDKNEKDKDRDIMHHPEHEASEQEQDELWPLLREIRRLNDTGSDSNWVVKHDKETGETTKEMKPEHEQTPITRKNFSNRYGNLLRPFGDYLFEKLAERDPMAGEIFKVIHDLNQPHKEKGVKTKGSYNPGTLRRTLSRKMDALYGHTQDPETGDFPQWRHAYEGEFKDWLKEIGAGTKKEIKKEEKVDRQQQLKKDHWHKSFVVFEPQGRELRKAVRLVIYDEVR